MIKAFIIDISKTDGSIYAHSDREYKYGYIWICGCTSTQLISACKNIPGNTHYQKKRERERESVCHRL